MGCQRSTPVYGVTKAGLQLTHSISGVLVLMAQVVRYYNQRLGLEQ